MKTRTVRRASALCKGRSKGCDEEKMNKLCAEERVKLLWAISGVFQITDLFPGVHKEGPFTVDS